VSHDFYIKLGEDGLVTGFPVTKSNLIKAVPGFDPENGELRGWIPYVVQEQDRLALPHRYYKKLTEEGLEDGMYVVSTVYIEVTDADERAAMRAVFYAEGHASAAIFDEYIGAWMRPTAEQLDTMSGEPPNVID
jgi:hypothetical protein